VKKFAVADSAVPKLPTLLVTAFSAPAQPFTPGKIRNPKRLACWVEFASLVCPVNSVKFAANE